MTWRGVGVRRRRSVCASVGHDARGTDKGARGEPKEGGRCGGKEEAVEQRAWAAEAVATFRRLDADEQFAVVLL